MTKKSKKGATIIRAKRSVKYSVIDNQVFSKNQLTWEGMGLLSYLLSKPDDWQIIPSALIKVTEGTRKKSGKDSVYTILRELKESGFIQMTRNSDGTVEYMVFDIPQQPETKSHKPACDTDNPDTDNPDTDNPDTDNPDTDNPQALLSTERQLSTKKEESTDIEVGEPAPLLSIEIKDHELGAVSRDQLERYCKYRSTRKKKLTNSHQALITVVKALNNLPSRISIDDAISVAIDRKWQGIKSAWVGRELATDNPEYTPENKTTASVMGIDEQVASNEFRTMTNYYKAAGREVIDWDTAWSAWLDRFIKNANNRFKSNNRLTNRESFEDMSNRAEDMWG